MPELDRGVHDGGVLPSPWPCVTNARSILSSSQVQALDVRERGIARAVVVDGQAEAALLQPRDGLLGALGVLHQRALGDFDGEQLGGNARACESRPSNSCGRSRSSRSRLETFTETLRRARRKPDATLARRLFHDPAGECLIMPVCSAKGMNSPGGTMPRSGCSQRTSASTPISWTPAQVQLGLVVQQELVPRDRPAQVAQQG